MEKPHPLLTIITVNFNNAAGLSSTIDSIIPQLDDRINYVIIDGGSSDESPEIISKVATQLYFSCSEKDGGIYEGMNKGVSHANGHYVLFINSGDRLLPEALRNVTPYLEHDAADIIYGNIIFLAPESGETQKITYPNKLTLHYLSESYLPHPGSFIKRKLLVDMPYNTDLRIVADWEFFVKAIVFNGASTLHIPVTVSEFEFGGISTSNIERHDTERHKAHNRLFTPILQDASDATKLESLACYEEILALTKTRKLHKRIRPILRMALAIDKLFHTNRK